jgi:hypothetical protein
MHFLLLSKLPHTREAHAHYDAFLSLKHERRPSRHVFAKLAHKLDEIARRLSKRRAV